MVIMEQVERVRNMLSDTENYLATQVLGGWNPADIPDLTGKTALVTGANSGIGFETARKLAENGAKVFMVSRDLKNGQEAAQKIRAEIGKAARVDVLECDMTRLQNVVDLAREFTQASHTLDILVNMAGVFYPGSYQKTPDGIEQTLAVNYYAPALLTLCLLDTMRLSPGSRVVFMSSALEGVGRLNFDNLKGEKYKDSGLIPCGVAKLMLTMFASELSRRVPTLDVFAVHPGLVATPMHEKSDSSYPINDMFKIATAMVGSTPKRGAWSTLYAATNTDIQGKGFKFFSPSLLFFNLWPTAERPFYRSGRVADQEKCWRLFEETQRTFDEILGAQAPPRLGLLVRDRS